MERKCLNKKYCSLNVKCVLRMFESVECMLKKNVRVKSVFRNVRKCEVNVKKNNVCKCEVCVKKNVRKCEVCVKKDVRKCEVC